MSSTVYVQREVIEISKSLLYLDTKLKVPNFVILGNDIGDSFDVLKFLSK